MSHNSGVKSVLDSMKEVLALYKKVTGNYRPMLDGERYLTDREVAEILKVPCKSIVMKVSCHTYPLAGKSFTVRATWKNFWKSFIIQPIG